MYSVPLKVKKNVAHGNAEFDQFYFGLFFKKYTLDELAFYQRFFQGWMRYLDRVLPVKNGLGKEVLEIGCGIGAFAKILQEREFTVYASDISAFIINQGKKLQSEIIFFVADIEKGIEIKKKFDFIFAFEVVEHLKDPLKALQNTIKLLKVKGVLVVTTPLPTPLVLSDPMHINVHTPGYWQDLAKKAGFKVKKCQVVSFVPFLYRFHHIFSWPLPFNTNWHLVNTTCFLVLQK